MVVLENIWLSALPIAFTLVLSSIDTLQLLMTRTALVMALACPAPTTSVNNRVDLDRDNLQLANPQGAEAKTIANMQDIGVKLPWKIDGVVKADGFLTYDAAVAEADTGWSIPRPTTKRPSGVRSATSIIVGCGTWGTDGNVTVVFNENINSAAEWTGPITTSTMIQYTDPANEQFETQVGNKVLSCNVNMVVHPTGEARAIKEGWIGVNDSKDGGENKSIMQRVILPVGDPAVTGVSIVDEVPADDNWSYDYDTVINYVKKHTFVVVDPATPEGQCLSKDTSKDTSGAGPMVEYAPQELTVTTPGTPANQSTIVEIPTRAEDAKHAADAVGKFSNTVTLNVPGKKVSPVIKTMRSSASADALTCQSFSATTRVDDELLDNTKDLGYTLAITLKNDSDSSTNRTYQTAAKAGKSDSYPGAFPPGTEVTTSKGDLPSADGVTLSEVESRVFDIAQGVILKANNRKTTFALSEDYLLAFELNNQLMPALKPAPKLMPMPTPTPTPVPPTPPARSRMKTGADAVNVGVLVGTATLVDGSLVAVKRHQH